MGEEIDYAKEFEITVATASKESPSPKPPPPKAPPAYAKDPTPGKGVRNSKGKDPR